LSAFPAQLAGLDDRGLIAAGAVADLVVYSLDELALAPMEVAYDVPGDEWRRTQRAEGYRCTLVGGEVTFIDGKETGATPGQVLSPARH
jgi:N-acyl-D-amino-acid deacylase